MSPAIPMTSARRIVLIAGVPIALALIGWTALSAVAFVGGQGSYSVSRSVRWSGNPIAISIDTGDLTVRPSGDDNVHVSGVVTYNLVKPTVNISTTGSTVSITLACNSGFLGVCSANLTVAVPQAAVTTVTSHSGDITARDLNDASLRSNSGDVRATGLGGITHLQADSGDISATALNSSDVVVADDSGAVSLQFSDVPQQVSVKDDSGDVDVALPAGGPAYNVSARSDSGTATIRVPTDPTSSHAISVAVASGDVHIGPNAG
jgi:Putative adhesin